jgi:non-specific serine/threonine protein kinase
MTEAAGNDAGPLAAELGAVGFDDAQEVGRGAFGVVFRANQRQLDRVVAVKVLTADLDRNRSRFVREQRAMGRLTGHPNIVPVLQIGETASAQPFLVMPYHGQGSLQQQIARRGVLAVDEALRVGMKMASALAEAHRLGVLHRDVKPGNILLNDYGDWALVDFGISHIPGGFTTATGVFSGSPAFTAPEVIVGEAPSTASDIYGLGATIFAALTGNAGHGLSADVADIVSGAMARRPQDRPSTQELGRQFEELLSSRHLAVDFSSLPAPDGDGPGSSAPSVRATVPGPLISFVGRRTELAEARQALSRSRLVTITGVGGVGKTSLAKQAAVQARPEFADGAWLIELADLRDASLAVEFIAGALGIRDKSEMTLTDVLVDFFLGQEILLVLDNCEHVTDSVADIVDTLLRSCPSLTILATSRERLDVEGETLLPLSPMSYPAESDTADAAAIDITGFDAVDLFVQQARTSDSDFAVVQDNAAAVIRICARLEGLPLAIELAAARLRVLSLDDISDALTDRYALLTRGRRGAPTRQRTLESCIEWSYQLCSPAEQHLWNQLSVFPGSFDLRAVQEICGDQSSEDEILDLISSLVDKSILLRLEQRRHVRFRMLETLRDYGHSRVTDTADFPVLSQRHADWYRHVLVDANSEWFSSRQNEWIHRVIDEMPNVRKSLGHSIEYHPDLALETINLLPIFWGFHGMLTEGRRWVARALEVGREEDPALRASAMYADGIMTALQGDIATAFSIVEEMRRLLSLRDDPITRGKMHFLEGFGAMLVGEVEHGIQRLHAAIDATGDAKVQEQSKVIMGWLFAVSGDSQQAMTWWQDALTVAQFAGDSICRAQALDSVGVGHWLLGDSQRGIRLIREGLPLSRSIDDMFTGAQSLELLSWITASEGDAVLATVLQAAALAVSRAGGAPAVLYANVGSFHADSEALLRRTLSLPQFEAATRYGNSLSLREAVGVALDGLSSKARGDLAGGSAEDRETRF